jgi:16S rRNA processing protein RimM
MVVKATHDSVDETERLIPWLPDSVVREVDLDSGTVTVDWYLDA